MVGSLDTFLNSLGSEACTEGKVRRVLMSCFLSEFHHQARKEEGPGAQWKWMVMSINHSQTECPHRLGPIQKEVTESRPGSLWGRRKSHRASLRGTLSSLIDWLCFPVFIIIIIRLSLLFFSPLSFMACYKGFSSGIEQDINSRNILLPQPENTMILFPHS